jgi:hypothetical protein
MLRFNRRKELMDIQTLSEGLVTVWQDFVAFLPTLAVGLLMVVGGYIIARLLYALSWRLLRRLGLDRVAAQAGIAEVLEQVGIQRSTSELIGRVVFWLVFLSFVLLVLDVLGLEAVVLLVQSLIVYLPRIFAALLIIVLGAFLAQLVGKGVQVSSARLGIEFHENLGTLVRWLLVGFALVIALEQLGLDLAIVANSLLLLVAVAIAGFALTFALGAHSLARNVLAGYYARELFRSGERIALDDLEGELDSIGTLNAEIMLDHGRLVIPNTRLIEGQVMIVRSPSE